MSNKRKTKWTSVIAVGILVLVAGYNVYASHNDVKLSDLALANVEALAEGEYGSGHCSAFASGQPGGRDCPGGPHMCCLQHWDVYGSNKRY
ncbi:MAG: NVEALA domain-containing protein [Mediterranea sp.]|nr:NVEALA domain-containing protein [Mediterranea sp.]